MERAIDRPRAPGAALLAAAVLAAAPAAAQDWEEVEIETHRLGGGLAMLVGRGGNIGVSVGEDGAFLIDDQYAPLTEKVRAAVRELAPDAPVRFVVNTHWHGDHTGGNENLGRAGAVIVAHENVRERMSAPQLIAALERRVPPSPAAALPVITFAESVTLHLNGHEIHVLHVGPAHTDGDAVVHFRDANVIHAGDVFFSGMYPFVDLSSGGSVEGVIAAAERILALCDDETRIIPGHGPLSGREELLAYRDMLRLVVSRVRAGIEAGRSEEEVVRSQPTETLDTRWGGGFLEPAAFVRIVYQSLGR
jgi:cyclase